MRQARFLRAITAAWFGPVLGALVACAGPQLTANASWAQAHWVQAPAQADPVEPASVKPERKWVTHKVVPKESLDEIGLRYGVSRREIIAWNRRLKKKAWIYAGQKLRIKARKFPPPRVKTTYIVRKGDTWTKIAKKFHTNSSALRYWNKKVPRAFRSGTKLTVYTNPVAPPPKPAGEGAAAEVSIIDVAQGGLSIGAPNRGRLQGGVQMPKSKDYTLRTPERAFGSTHAVTTIQTAIANFRRDSGYRGKLLIADLSRKTGGRLRHHGSHRTGRDVDIRVPKLGGRSVESDAMNTVDWDATWQLVKAFLETGEVEYIFLESTRQKQLYRAAKRAGVSDKALKRYIQYPRKRGTTRATVRHSKGHRKHIHVRIKCAKHNSRCKTY